MKIKITLLVCLGLIISLNVIGQKINLDDQISIVFPSNSQKLSSTSVVSTAKQQNIKINEYHENNNNRQFYILDNVIVRLLATKEEKEVDLVKLKAGLVEMNEGSKNIILDIINKNGNQYLIVKDISQPKIRFFATNSSKNRLVTGVLDFKEMSRTKASSLLNTILSTMSFKK